MKILRAVFLITLVSLMLPVELYARDDWQYWNMVQLQGKLHEKWAVRAHGEQWLTNDFSRISLNNVEAGFLWKPFSFFEAGPFYRYQYTDAPKGPNVGENRYTIEASLRFRANAWEFSDRNRVEFRETTQRNFWVYRNQMRLAYHCKIKNTPLLPYISEELFQRGDGTGINENRAAAGIQMRFHKHFGLTLFYLIRHTKGKPDWKSDQVMGTTFQIYI